MNDELINKITNISEKFHFEYLEDYENELKLEYTGNDVIFKEKEDFENYDEWIEFKIKQDEIVEREFEKAIKEIKKSIPIKKYEYDDYDYVCVYLYL